MLKKISIIVPVYNAEKYLDKCIESILRQTYKNIEILLIDDGSKDNSGCICEKWAKSDDRIRVYHKPNGGVSSARNLGLENASGKYIMFVDSDDSIDSNICEIFFEELNQGVDWVIGGIANSAHQSNEKENKKSERLKEISEIFDTLYARGLCHSVCAKIYKRNIIAQQRFDSRVYMGEDLLFNLEYLEKVKQSATIVSYYGYHYNLDNDSSAIHTFKDDLFEQQVYLYKKTLQFLKKMVISVDVFKINKMLLDNAMGYLQKLYFSQNKRKYKRKYAFSCLNNEYLQQCYSDGIYTKSKDKILLRLMKRKKERMIFLYFKIKFMIKKILKKQ